MERLTGLWADSQRSKRMANGGIFSSCEVELQELMKQIDIMVHNKRMDWEREMSSVKSRLESRERECQIQRGTLEQKHREIGQLRQQIDGAEKTQREMMLEYEKQVSQLRLELQNLKRDYEKLQKRHSKHTREVERERERKSLESQDNMAEVNKLTEKLEEYKHKSSEWDLERRTYQKQVESLESQRKALADKCELIQQQTQGYQSQLDKRRQILDNTEINLKSQISHLEGQLERAKDTMNAQEEKIEKLKSTLDDSALSQRRVVSETEQVTSELVSTREVIRKLQVEKSQLEADLTSRDQLLRMAEEDQRYHAEEMKKMEKSMMEKDDYIQSLLDLNQRKATDQISHYKQELVEARGKIKSYKRNEQRLQDNIADLESKLEDYQTQYSQLSSQLRRKEDEIRIYDNTEIQQLQSELNRAKERVNIMQSSHDSQLDGMRKELSNVTQELHERNLNMAALSEKAANTERLYREAMEMQDKKGVEMQVTGAQLDALRLENKHLRQTLLKQGQVGSDIAEAESHLRELQNAYTVSLAKLGQENEQLKQDVTHLENEIHLVEQRAREAATEQEAEAERTFTEMKIEEERKIHDMKEDYERKLVQLSEKYNTAVEKYETDIKEIRGQRDMLQQQLDEHRQYLRRISNENYAMSDFVQGVESIVQSPPKRPTSIIGGSRSHDPSISLSSETLEESSNNERPTSRASISAQFLAEEQQRAKELERILDSHIQELKTKTDATIKEYES